MVEKNSRRKFMKRTGAVGIASFAAGSSIIGSAAADEDATIRGGIHHGDGQTTIEGASMEFDGPSFYEIDELEETWYLINVEPGEYTVTVTADGYETTTDTVIVESGETKGRDFNLKPENSGTLDVALVDENGDPINSDRIRANLDGVRSLSISPDNEFEIELQEDLWVFDLEVLGYDFEREIISITEDETTEIEPELASNNKGEAGVYIWTEGDVPTTDLYFEGPEDKHVTYEGDMPRVGVLLETGQYIVEADPEGYEPKLDAIEIEHASQTPVNFDYM